MATRYIAIQDCQYNGRIYQTGDVYEGAERPPVHLFRLESDPDLNALETQFEQFVNAMPVDMRRMYVLDNTSTLFLIEALTSAFRRHIGAMDVLDREIWLRERMEQDDTDAAADLRNKRVLMMGMLAMKAPGALKLYLEEQLGLEEDGSLDTLRLKKVAFRSFLAEKSSADLRTYLEAKLDDLQELEALQIRFDLLLGGMSSTELEEFIDGEING